MKFLLHFIDIGNENNEVYSYNFTLNITIKKLFGGSFFRLIYFSCSYK
jgi:hypothetical protein